MLSDSLVLFCFAFQPSLPREGATGSCTSNQLAAETLPAFSAWAYHLLLLIISYHLSICAFISPPIFLAVWLPVFFFFKLYFGRALGVGNEEKHVESLVSVLKSPLSAVLHRLHCVRAPQ